MPNKIRTKYFACLLYIEFYAIVQAKGDIANHLKDDEDDNLLKAEKLKEREEARKEKAWYNLW